MDLSKRYTDINGKKCDILEMMVASPEWAANRIQAGEDAIAELAELVVAYNKLCDITRRQGADICAMKEALGHNRIMLADALAVATAAQKNWE